MRYIFVLVFFIIGNFSFIRAQVLVSDFNNKKFINNLGGMFGWFDFDPNDKDAYCRVKFIKDKELHFKGNFLRVDYDVFSKKTAFNGLWFKLKSLNLKPYKNLMFRIKGDVYKGIPDTFKIELKAKGKVVYFIFKNDNKEDYGKIGLKWSFIKIPLVKFKHQSGYFDFSSVDELVFVFEDSRMKVKEGRIYLDDIMFVK